MRGLFITLEGSEGAGKTTQLELLAERLSREQIDVLTLREPGGTPIGEEIRHTLKQSAANAGMTPETELLLLNASRAQLVRERIQPALERGVWVLCDRFIDSTIAYQGEGRRLDFETVRAICDFATDGLKPDLTLLLQIPVVLSEERRSARSAGEAKVRDRFEEADRSFYERVERGFRALAAAEPDRIRPVDASLPIGPVSDLIWTEISSARQRQAVEKPGGST